MADRILLTRENGVAEVSLNRPDKRNALDLEAFRAIAETQKELARERDLRAVILTGSGVDFCSGLDIKSVMEDPAGMRRLLWKWLPWQSNLAQVVSTGWRRLPVPVIAAIQGRCWGGGFQIALGADFRIVHPNASLSIMESKWGLAPDMGGSIALRELTGRDQATWLAMSAEEFSGRRALELGLATAVTDDPAGVSRALAGQLLDRSPDAVAGIKRLFLRSWRGRSGTALARETLYQLRILAGANQRIAVKRQFGEKIGYRPRSRW
jgi:enoyl-CoA hydratase/carnithine racemase